MGDLEVIKNKIFKDEKIEYILDALDCHNIHYEQGGELIVAALPDGDNKRSVQVRNNEHLYSRIRSKGVKGDIFNIVSYIKFNSFTQEEMRSSLHDSKMWIVSLLKYQELLYSDEEIQNKNNLNDWLREIKKKRKKSRNTIDTKPNKVIDEDILKSYLFIPYKKWVDEGININTQKEWEVGYDWSTHRVITPIRNINGELLGIKGRAMDDNEFKYLYLYNLNKSIELFGLHKTLPFILKEKQIILFEGYKSIFKSWQYGIKNVSSFEGDDISLEQVNLIKSFGLDIDIVLCYDKDKKEKDIKEQCKKFIGRKVYYTLDRWNLLDDKDSPVDKGKKVFKYLLKNKKEYMSK